MATCHQSPYLPSVPSVTKPAIVIVTSFTARAYGTRNPGTRNPRLSQLFSLWHHLLLRPGRVANRHISGQYWQLSCLSVLSETLVYCGQMAGWNKMPLGTEVGLGAGDIVLDGDPAPPARKGAQRPPLFAHFAVAWSPIKSQKFTDVDFTLSAFVICVMLTFCCAHRHIVCVTLFLVLWFEIDTEVILYFLANWQDHRSRWPEDKTTDLGHSRPGAFPGGDSQLLPWRGRSTHGLWHYQVSIAYTLLYYCW